MKAYTTSVYLGALLALAIPHGVQAHGYVKKVEILNGQSYTGAKPGATAPKGSPIRAIVDQSPVKNPQGEDMTCGLGATPAPGVASAKPGDTLVYSWANIVAADGNWIHDTGPMMTYFAQVPSGQNITTFTGEGAKWFKTDQAGKKGGVWIQKSLMTGGTFKTKIPEALPNGQYLVRHEIIGLHVAKDLGGAEFYPSCLQLEIKNSNADPATFTASPTVSFPGAYKATDPGILVDVFNQAADGSEYKFPGGAIAKFTGGNSRARRMLRWERRGTH